MNKFKNLEVPHRLRLPGLLLGCICAIASTASAATVTVFTESFETDGDTVNGDGRYLVQNQSDDGSGDYFDRREVGSPGIFIVAGGALDGTWFFASQDLDGDGVAVDDLAANEGRVIWQTPIDITGLGNFTLMAAVASKDQNEFDNPLAFQYRIDGGEWLTAGGFRGLHSDSPSYYFVGGNFTTTSGTVPSALDPRATRTMHDWEWPINGTGDTLELRFFVNANGGTEGYAIDNIRITADDALSFVTPALNQDTFDETDGVNAGNLTLTLAGPATGDVVFTITDSDDDNTEADLPASVTVPNGQTSVSVDFDILADNRYDGNEPIIVTITSPGYANERLLFTVNNVDPTVKVYIDEFFTTTFCADEFDPTYDTNGDGICLEDHEEFMELINAEDFVVDISSWEIWDERGPRHIFGPNTFLQPHQSAVVFGGGDPRGAFGGSIVETSSQGNFSFGGDGENISVRAGPSNADGAIVFDYTYTGLEGDTGNGLQRNEKWDDPGVLWDGAGGPSTMTYVPTSQIPAAGGALFTPGLRLDGTPFQDFNDTLTLVVDATEVAEDGADVTATVSLKAAAPAGGVEVTLAADKEGDEVSMPASVTITEGSTSQGFTISAVDDGLLDGDREVKIRATATSIEPGIGYLTVTDIAVDPYDVVINEAFADTVGTSLDLNGNGVAEESVEDQYIEIVNRGGEAVNLTGWMLITDRSNGPDPAVTVEIFDGTILKPEGSVVIFGGGDEVAMQKASAVGYGNAIIKVGNNSYNGVNLTDEGDIIISLITPDGHTEDTFEYGEDIADQNQAITRDPNTSIGLPSLHGALSGTLEVGSPGREVIDGSAFTGNGITSAEVLGGGAVPLGDDWYWSDWFGAFSTTFEPWIYHSPHGFLYLYTGSVTDDDLYLYDNTMVSWWWSTAATYPWMYAFDPSVDNQGVDVGASWLFYFDDNVSPRFFAVYGTSPTTFLEFD